MGRINNIFSIGYIRDTEHLRGKISKTTKFNWKQNMWHYFLARQDCQVSWDVTQVLVSFAPLKQKIFEGNTTGLTKHAWQKLNRQQYNIYYPN